MLLNITYNTLKLYQNEFLERLLTNIDNLSCEFTLEIPMDDYST